MWHKRPRQARRSERERAADGDRQAVDGPERSGGGIVDAPVRALRRVYALLA
jgi:hypothetical protein